MVDIQHIDALRSAEELCEAYKITYDPELGVSESFITSKRLEIIDAAVTLGFYSVLKQCIADCEKKLHAHDYISDIIGLLDVDRRGNPLNVTCNYLTIMRNDATYAKVKYNEMTGMPETEDKNGKTRLWTDADDAASRTYIEKMYGIHSAAKHNDALLCLFEDRKYHPIKQIIESTQWDGVKRIPHLLTKWAKAEDTEYTREVSRLVFAGGINRLYHPGCKFDDMVVFVGEQGCGKSSFARFLAIQDNFFVELKTIEGKQALEAISGAWIVEIPELSALTKMREQESIKAFLSTLSDKYRPAYGRYTIMQHRTCSFIGTSNNYQFIADKTGGRRFYPVEFNCGREVILGNEKACREYIKQCWAEAYAALDTEYMRPYADPKLDAQIKEKQDSAAEDDYRIGMIEAYLNRNSGKDVCFGMIWEEVLGNDLNKSDKSDQTQIGMIMRNMRGWERHNTKRNFGRYGMQKFWRCKAAPNVSDPPSPATPNDSFPF